MLDRVLETISRYSMLPPAARVGVAVSGGADSVCLLHALHQLGYALGVVHIEHGIRGEPSRVHAEWVRDLAGRLGLEFHLRAVDVRSYKGNLEQAARRARYSFFEELIATGAVDRIATGHTLSDQAETVLLRLIRGSGPGGLAGILPVTAEGIVRPLLAIERPDVEAWLSERGIPWCQDETNSNTVFCRNRIRHNLLPLLRREYNAGIDGALARAAALFQAEEAYWKARLPPICAVNGAVVLDVELLRGDVAEARRVARKAIEAVRGNLLRIESRHVEQVLELARAEPGTGQRRIPAVDVQRSFRYLRLARTGMAKGLDPTYRCPVPVPGTVRTGNTRISLEVVERSGLSEPCGTVVERGDRLDWKRIPSALEVRNWRPGDQYRPAGVGRPEKIKNLFQTARVPVWDRPGWPVLVAGEQILWSRHFGVDAEVAASSETERVIAIREIPEAPL